MPAPDVQTTLDRLARSRFRARFRLRDVDHKYIEEKGLETVLAHADRFIRTRLAPAHPAHDGRQTPTKGHPIFIAQHATATCCRTCLRTWHGMPPGVALSEAQIAQILQLLTAWLTRQPLPPRPTTAPPTLFDPTA